MTTDTGVFTAVPAGTCGGMQVAAPHSQAWLVCPLTVATDCWRPMCRETLATATLITLVIPGWQLAHHSTLGLLPPGQGACLSSPHKLTLIPCKRGVRKLHLALVCFDRRCCRALAYVQGVQEEITPCGVVNRVDWGDLMKAGNVKVPCGCSPFLLAANVTG